ncbi:MAG: dienelactone hydrolase family protein [Burkholderiaceae bacterium]
MRPLRWLGAVCALTIAACAAAAARTVEEQFELPVQVTDSYGKAVARPITVTVFRDDARDAPQPLIVMNHGRAVEAADRAALGRARMADAARWFVREGFVVAVPTRVGYGVTGGDDVEDSGACGNKRYASGFAAAAQQTAAVLAAMQRRPEVATDRAIVLGQSFGGMTAVAVAAQAPPGVAAAINFAGGAGGNPKTRPGRPCDASQLERLAGAYGASARIPMLWLYTENDRYFGPDHPKAWFEAFHKSGGVGEFVQFPPTGDDGHALFTAFPQVWHPAVADFLRRQGFDMKDAP